MNKTKASFLGNISLSLCLVGTIALVSTLWYRSEAAWMAPTVSGYSWSDQRETLVIAYPPGDCGCGTAPTELVAAGLKRDKNVLVLASAPSSELQTYRVPSDTRARFSLVTRFSPEAAQRLGVGEKAALALVAGGRIKRWTPGTTLPPAFLD